MTFRVQVQLEEAFGCLNRWFCSQAYGQEVTDREVLLRYFIKSGGAEDFDRRYAEAMGGLNRWYCSECYGYGVYDPQTLWDYYMSHRQMQECDLAQRLVAC